MVNSGGSNSKNHTVRANRVQGVESSSQFQGFGSVGPLTCAYGGERVNYNSTSILFWCFVVVFVLFCFSA